MDSRGGRSKQRPYKFFSCSYSGSPIIGGWGDSKLTFLETEPNASLAAFKSSRNGRCIMDSRYRVRKTFGFTLIELLIVVAIITVIAAILFPVFVTVRERGRRTVCQSNLKQIALAMQQYIQDNNGTFPSSADWGYAPYSYLKSADVFRCPDHAPNKSTDQFSLEAPITSANHLEIWEGTTAPVDYTFNMTRLNTTSPPYPSHGPLEGVQEAKLLTPSTIWLNVDAFWTDNDGDHYFRTVPTTSCGRTFNSTTLHSGAGNYSYIDGHVKWLTPEEAGEIECANGPLPAPFKD